VPEPLDKKKPKGDSYGSLWLGMQPKNATEEEQKRIRNKGMGAGGQPKITSGRKV